MAQLFLDMRCSTVRYLVREGDDTLCRGVAEFPSEGMARSGEGNRRPRLPVIGREDRSGIAEVLKLAAAQSGAKLREVHLVLPHGDVTLSSHKVQAMPRSDMEKVIARKLAAEQGEPSPIFSMTPLLSGPKSAACLVESIPRPAVAKYLRTFAAEKVRLLTVSTSLNTTLLGLGESSGTHAVFDINRDFLEAFYATDGVLVHYERIVFPPDQDEEPGRETGDAGAAERSHRRWLFGVVNTIYTIHSGYMAGNASSPVERVWLCGLECGADGIRDALKDSMDADVLLAAGSPMEEEEAGHHFVTLDGLARAVADGIAVNLIPQEMLGGRRLTPDRLKVAATAASVAMMLTAGIAVEVKHDRLASRLSREKKEMTSLRSVSAEYQAYARNLDALKKLTAGQVVFYGLFRELADRLPDGAQVEKMEFRQNGERGLLKFTAATPYQQDIGRKQVMSRLVAFSDSSLYLRRTTGPFVAVSGKDRDRMVEITLECEVRPREAIR